MISSTAVPYEKRTPAFSAAMARPVATAWTPPIGAQTPATTSM
jgi:hypothetical protein